MIAFTLDAALVIQLLVSTVLPLLVGLVTKTITRAGIKAVLLAGLALATSLLTELGASVAAGTTYDVGRGLLLALPTFLIAVGLHYGLWKPVGAAEKAQEMFHTEQTKKTQPSARYLLHHDETVIAAAKTSVDNAVNPRQDDDHDRGLRTH